MKNWLQSIYLKIPKLLVLVLLAIGAGASCALAAHSVSTTTPILETIAPLSDNPLVGGYVASGKGAVYYLPWCGNAFRIKTENRVVFDSENEAILAGFRAAKGCRGLTGG